MHDVAMGICDKLNHNFCKILQILIKFLYPQKYLVFQKKIDKDEHKIVKLFRCIELLETNM